MSLRQPTAKMSKSHPDERSRILLSDSAEEIETKIRSALTDSEPGITYQPTERPGLSNLLHIASHIQGGEPSPSELAFEFRNSRISALKSYVASGINQALAGYRERYLDLMNESGTRLSEVASCGAAGAQANASRTMDAVRQATGLA